MNLVAPEGLGGDDRAKSDGLVLNLSLIPYGFNVPDDAVVTSTNQVTIGDLAAVEAGINSQSLIHIEPLTLNGQPRLDPARLGTQLTAAEKQALGLPVELAYEYVALNPEKIAFSISTGTVIQVVAGANQGGTVGHYYQYRPYTLGSDSIYLEYENYADSQRWADLGDTLTQEQLEDLTIYTSDATLELCADLRDKFYAIKPVQLDAPTVAYVNLTNLLFDQREEVLDWIASHSGNADAIARYQVRLQELEDALQSLGLVETVTDPNNPTVSAPAVQREVDILVLQLPSIYAAPGSVYIQADGAADSQYTPLLGTQLIAHGGARIEISNRSPLAMEVRDAVVRDNRRVAVIDGVYTVFEPGNVYVNNGLITSNTSGDPSTISVVQDAYPDAQYDLGDLQLPQVDQDLYILGDMINESGSLTISNQEGSINVSGELRAASVTLYAARDFNLNSDDWLHTNADPRQYPIYDNLRSQVFNSAGATKTNTYARAADVPGLEAAIQQDQSAIVAQGNITISARYLNINGRVQSGVQTATLHVAASFTGTSTTRSLLGDDGQPLPGVSYGAEGVPISAYFDPAQQAIIVEDFVPTGGNINLSGQILSTGNGLLRVASGYASVDIQNDSPYRLILNRIDTTTNREGKITVSDTAALNKIEYTVDVGGIRETRYQGVYVPAANGNISRIDYTQTHQVTHAPGETVQYQPQAGFVYAWTEGQEKTKIERTEYEDESFQLFFKPWDVLVKDEEYEWTEVTYTDRAPLLESESLLPDGTNSVPTYASGQAYTIRYEQRDDTTVGLKPGLTQVRDITGGNKVYRYKSSAPPAELVLAEISYATDANWQYLSVNNSDSFPDPAADRFDSDYVNYSVDVETWTTGGGWLRKTTYHTLTTTTTGLKDFYTHTLKADYPIDIELLAGLAAPQIRIQSGPGVYLQGDIESPAQGQITLTSLQGSITSWESIAIYGVSPTVTAGPTGDDCVQVSVEGNQGPLRVAAGGDIRLTAVSLDNRSSSLLVGRIDSAHGGVSLAAPDGLFAADATSLIVGGLVQLDASRNAIGSSALPLRVDSYANGAGGLAARSQGDLFVSETAGDLLLAAPTAWEGRASVDSAQGSVHLSTVSGSIFDGIQELASVGAGDAPLDPQLQELVDQGLYSEAALRYPLSPGLAAYLYPRADFLGLEPSSFSAEVANVRGAQVVLDAGGQQAQIGRVEPRVSLPLEHGYDGLTADQQQLLASSAADDVQAAAYAVYEFRGGAQSGVDLWNEDFSAATRWRRLETDYTFIARQGSQPVKLSGGEVVLVEYPQDYIRYRYLGEAGSFDLAQENFFDAARWKELVVTYANDSHTPISLATGQLVADKDVIEWLALQPLDSVDVQVSGALTARAGGAIFVNGLDGLRVNRITSDQDAVELRTSTGDLVDANNDAAANAIGLNVTLVSAGRIGSAANPFDVDTRNASGGVLTVEAAGDAYVAETSGPVTVGDASSAGGLLSLAVLNTAATNEDLILPPNAAIRAMTGITLAADNLETSSGSEITTSGAGSRIDIDTVFSMKLAGLIEVQGSGSMADLHAGDSLTLLPHGVVSGQGTDSLLKLYGAKQLVLQPESAVLAGAAFDTSGAAPVAVVTFAGADGTLTSGHELIIQGTVTTSDQMTLTAGTPLADNSSYFKGLPPGHYLTGTSQFSLLLQGTLTTLAGGNLLELAAPGAVILQGNLATRGSGSDLRIRSEKSVYVDGQLTVQDQLEIYGGYNAALASTGGADGKGSSVYVDTVAIVQTQAAGSDIRLQGAQDVDILGSVIAAGQIGTSGVTFVNDGTITVTAGQQVYLRGGLETSQSIAVSGGTPGTEDKGLSVLVDTAGGIYAVGKTSAKTGAHVELQAVKDISVMGYLVSGGSVLLTRNAQGEVQSRTFSWSSEPSDLLVHAGGQAQIGGTTTNASGQTIQTGGYAYAGDRVRIEGGTHASGQGVFVQPGSEVVTHGAASAIQITSLQDANLQGTLLAGGEIQPGSKLVNFGGRSTVTAQAQHQLAIGTVVQAGAAITLAGGVDPVEQNKSDSGKGLLLYGSARVQTWATNSTINLSAATASAAGRLEIQAASPASDWSVQAAGAGSVVNVGTAAGPNGKLYLAGRVRADAAINVTSGVSSDGIDVDLRPTARLETNNGPIKVSAGQFGDLQGTVVAGGTTGDVQLTAVSGLLVRGVVQAQRHIDVTTTGAGLVHTDFATRMQNNSGVSPVNVNLINNLVDGQMASTDRVSVLIDAAGQLNVTGTDATQRHLRITGYENAIVNGPVGTSSASLYELQVQVQAATGDLYVAAQAGRLESDALLILKGDLVDVAGVVRSTAATSTAGNWETDVTARTARLRGDVSSVGSLRVTASSRIEAYNNTTVTGVGQTLKLDSQGTLTLGSAGLVTGKLTNLGGVLQAPHQVLLSSAGLTEIKPAISVASTEQDSQVQIAAGELKLAGALYGGARPGSTVAWTGRSADILVTVTGAFSLAGKGYDQNGISVDWAGSAEATGTIQITAGSITSLGPGNTPTTAPSLIRSNAAGDGSLTGTLGTSFISVNASGDAALFGVIKAEDANSTVSITAGGLLSVDGIVRAQGAVALTGGKITDGRGLLVTALAVEKDSYGNAVALVDGAKRAIDADGNLIDPQNPSQYVDKTGKPVATPVYGGEPIRVSGGSIETGTNGTIIVAATGHVVLQGQVGDVQDVDGVPATNVSAVTITSTAGQVQIYDLVNARNAIDITATDIRVIDVALVKTRYAGSEIYLRATGLIDVERSPTTLHRAKVDSGALLHFYGGQIHVGGEILARDAGSRILLNSSGTLAITGQAISQGKVDLYAGVPVYLTEAQSLAGGFPVTSLSQGLLSITGQTGLDQRKEPAPLIVETETTEQQLVGYHLEEDGSVTVTETVYEETTVQELVGYEDVVVGSTWNTMNLTLKQDGYWNDQLKKRREYLIEGIDYTNAKVFGNAGMTTPFEQLTDAQRTQVLNALNYKPLYDVTIGDPREYTRINGATTYQAWAAALNWNPSVTSVIYVNVSGLSDKYLRVPSDGAATIRDTILNVVSQGAPVRLPDETVGNYVDFADVKYTQDKSAYAARQITNRSFYDPYLGTVTAAAYSTVDYDNTPYPRWAVSYRGNGLRNYSLTDGVNSGLNRVPGWSSQTAFIEHNDLGDTEGNVRLAYAPQSYFDTSARLEKNASGTSRPTAVGQDPYGSYVQTAYAYVDGSYNWPDAVQAAARYAWPGGAKIATPKNQAQNDGTKAVIPSGKRAWIGGVLATSDAGNPNSIKVDIGNFADMDWMWIDNILTRSIYLNDHNDLGFYVSGRDTFANEKGVAVTSHYTHWKSGQPDHDNGHENYTEMYDTGYWNDEDIDRLNGYAVQKTGYFSATTATETFTDFFFRWTSSTTSIKDVRYQAAYAWTGQARDITEPRPVYHEKTVLVPKTVTKQITTWKLVPDYQTVTVITTERVYEDEGQLPVQPSGTFNGDSISAAGAVTLTTGGDVLVQGNVNASSAASTIAITAGGNVTVQGVLPAGAELAAVAQVRSAGGVSITAAGAILVADSARLTAEAAGGDIALRAGVGFVSAGPVLGGDVGEGLDLDGNILYAVNARGPGGLQVRDALFTDQASQPNVTITAGSEILNWKNPNYGSTTNDNNLEAVMQSIRWSTNPSTLNIDLGNLTVGAFYKMQLLFHENGANRGFDIFAEGKLILNDFSPSLVSSSGQGAVVTYTFAAADPTLNVVLNGAATPFSDKNPILQGVTLELLPTPVGSATAGPVLGGDVGEGLDLDGNMVYAVNARGPGGLQVRDALFTDQAGQPNVVITAQKEVLNWQNHDYGSSTDDNNLETVMQSIRWSSYPSTVNIDVANLTVGALYKLQLLFQEKSYPRGFDVFAEGNLILNDFSTNPASSPGQGAVASYTFVAGDPTLNVVLNGAATAFSNKDPILQGVTLELLAAPGGVVLDGELSAADTVTVTAPGDVTLGGPVTAGTTVDVQAGTDGSGSILGGLGAEVTAGGGISLTAGAASGNIILDGSQLTTQQTVALTAAGGSISQTRTPLAAAKLVARAKSGLTAYTRISTLDAQLSGSGNIRLTNVRSTSGGALPLTLPSVIAKDGTIDISAFGNIAANNVKTQGSSDSNDISLRTHAVSQVSSNLSFTDIQTGGSGDVTLTVDGAILEAPSSTQPDPRVWGDRLTVRTLQDLNISTRVNSLAIPTGAVGNVTIDETDALELVDVTVAGALLRVTAGGHLTATRLRIPNNRQAEIQLVSGGSIYVGQIDAGAYAADSGAATDLRLQYFNGALRTIGFLKQGDPDWTLAQAQAFNSSHPSYATIRNGLIAELQRDGFSSQAAATEADLILTLRGQLDSLGRVTLSASKGAITNLASASNPIVTADRVSFSAANSVSGFLVAAGTLENAQATNGPVAINHRNGYEEVTPGLAVLSAVSGSTGTVSVNITSPGHVTIGALGSDSRTVTPGTVNAGTGAASTVQVNSDHGNVLVYDSSTISVRGGISLLAGGSVSASRLPPASDRIEVRAGRTIDIDTLASPALQANTIIIEQGDSLHLHGVLTARDLVQLTTHGGNLRLGGTISGGTGQLQEVRIWADGTTPEQLLVPDERSGLVRHASPSGTVYMVDLEHHKYYQWQSPTSKRYQFSGFDANAGVLAVRLFWGTSEDPYAGTLYTSETGTTALSAAYRANINHLGLTYTLLNDKDPVIATLAPVRHAVPSGNAYIAKGTVIAGNVVRLEAPQGEVVVETGAIINSLTGQAVLQARDELELAAGSEIHAPAITLQTGWTGTAGASSDSRLRAAGVLDALSILILGNSGQDTVWLGSDGTLPGSLDRIRGNVEFRGGGGADVLNLDDRGAVDDTGRPLRAGYAVTPLQVADNPGRDFPDRQFAGLTYDASVARLHLLGSAGSAVFHVRPSTAADYVLEGSTQADNSVVLAPTGTVGATLQDLYEGGQAVPNAGTWTFGDAHRPVEFRGMLRRRAQALEATGRAFVMLETPAADATIALVIHSFTAVDLAHLIDSEPGILVSGPNGYSQWAQFMSARPSADGTAQIVTFSVPAPDGGWDKTDDGQYAISVVAGKIQDCLGHSLPAALAGSLWVNIGRTWLTSTRQGPDQYRLDVSNATPGGIVVFAYGTQPGQYTLDSIGVTLDIADPVFLATAVVPPSSHVQVQWRVPPELEGQQFIFQAFQQATDPHSQPAMAGVSQPVTSLTLPSLVSSIVPLGEGVRKTGTVEFVATFRQEMGHLSACDFELAASPGVSGAQITTVHGDGTTYTVTAATGTGDGRIGLDFRDDTPLAAALGLEPTRTRNGRFEGETFILHNTAQDVNLDFLVTPLDLLVLINVLNQHGCAVTVGGDGSIPTTYDVSGDGWVSPLDVLLLINYLNQFSPAAGEGEAAPSGVGYAGESLRDEPPWASGSPFPLAGHQPSDPPWQERWTSSNPVWSQPPAARDAGWEPHASPARWDSIAPDPGDAGEGGPEPLSAELEDILAQIAGEVSRNHRFDLFAPL